MPLMDRKSARRDNAVTVRARCGRCERVVAEVHGPDADTPTTYWSPPGAFGLLPRVGLAVRWPCRCGSNYPIRAEKLEAAFRAAAGRSRRRDRVIRLPADLRG